VQKYVFQTKGICPDHFVLELEGEVVVTMEASRGCDGNLKGIGLLLAGRKAEDLIVLLDGVTCGKKNTSCPMQIADALKKIRAGELQPVDG